MRSPSPDDSSLRTLLLPPYSHEEHDPAVRTHVATSSMAERDLLPIDRTMHMDMHMDMTADSDAETRDPHKRKVTPDHTQRHESEPADQTIDHDNQSEPRTPTESNPAKRARRNPSVRCPICNEVVPPGQYQQHYRMELAQIESSSSHESSRGKRGAAIAATKFITKGKQRTSGADVDKRNLVRDIQKRRTARQSNKDFTPSAGSNSLDLGLVGALGGESIGNDDSPATCFICNERLYGSLDDINSHIDSCLTNPQPGHGPSTESSRANTPMSAGDGHSGRNSAATTPGAHVVDSFEEYTWAGQTRVRATALFEGGMGSLGSGSRTVQEDIDDDLDIEEDEEDEYGGAQFTERDVVLNEEIEPGADELREIVIASSSAVQRPPSPPPRRRLAVSESSSSSKIDREVDIEDMGDDPGDVDDTEVDEDAEIDLEGDGDDDDDDDDVDEDDETESDRVNAMISSAFASGDTKLVIDALRAKIKHLESASKNAPTCLICLDPYTVPLTSIVCWHVHCEACWMKTLGSKKLCPQCQKITLPKDLRRIYL